MYNIMLEFFHNDFIKHGNQRFLKWTSAGGKESFLGLFKRDSPTRFSTSIFSSFEPARATDYWVKIVPSLVTFSPSYLNFSIQKLTPHCYESAFKFQRLIVFGPNLKWYIVEHSIYLLNENPLNIHILLIECSQNVQNSLKFNLLIVDN